MAEETKEQTVEAKPVSKDESSNGGGSKIAIIIIVVLLVAAGAFVLFKPSDDKKTEESNMEAEMEEVMSEEDKAAMEKKQADQEMENAMKMEKIAKGVLALEARAQMLRPSLTPNGVESLDVILVFVQDNPDEVLMPSTDYPEEIQAAIATVKAEAEALDHIGTGVLPKSKTGTIVTSSGEEVELTVGEDYEVTGILNEVEEGNDQEGDTEEGDEEGDENTSDDVTTPLGNAYTLTLENGGQLYFIFNDENSQAIEPLLGEEVDVTVQVEEINEVENIVTYKVVSMPTLSESTSQ